MHKAGWVHRNLNTGTIVIGTDGRAKLTGLEYAKRVNDMNEPHTVRTVRLFLYHSAFFVLKFGYIF